MDSRNYELVQDRLTNLIATTARMDPKLIDPYENLIELGADSIILTDVNSYIREEFSVEIPLTLFFERLTSVAEIVDFLYPQLSPEYFDKSIAPDTEETVTEKIDESTAYILNEYSNTKQEYLIPRIEPLARVESADASLTQLFAQQLEVINNQIRLLSGNQVAASTSVDSPPWSKESGAPQAAAPAKHRAEEPVSHAAQQPYIPHKRIEMTKKQGDEKQQLHIHQLMERYTAKTKRSKEFAATYRLPYADWRNISGFRPAIKEMVYQLVFEDSQGSHITDIDGNDYIDLTMDFGVSLFGHNADFIKEAISQEMVKGFPLSLITALSGEVAQYICECTGVERVSFFNSGTEAVMVAMRLARAATGKNKIVMFSGAYHGTFDGVLGMHPLNREKDAVSPIAGGILQSYVDDLFILDYDSPDSLAFITEHAHEIAAVMVEPVQSRRPDLQPREFLHQLRALTETHHMKLIFDEMILGFRLGKGGAQEYFGVQADLVTFGKIVGGGMPIGIVAGKHEVMDCIDGGVWQYGDDSIPPYEDKRTFAGGTFCHHPLAMAAAKAVLLKIKEESETIYPLINKRTAYLAEQLNAFFLEHGVPAEIVYCGSLFRFVLKGNMEMFYYHLLDKGVYIWEGRNCFLSTCHSDEDIEKIIKAVKEACMQMKHVFFAKNEAGDSSSAIKKKSITLTVEQQRMLAAEVMNQGTSAFNQCILLQITGELDADDVNKAAAQIANRHEALRYTFSSDMAELLMNDKLDADITNVEVEPAAEREVLASLTQLAFDYQNGPLIKLFLLRDGQDRMSCKLLIVAHHFIADGWSLSLFCEELIEAYNGLRTGANPRFSEAMAYSEYLKQKETELEARDKQGVLQFWRNYLAECDHELALPRKQIMALPGSGKGERLTFTTDELWLNKVRKAAAAAKCSPFIIMLSVYQAMLNQLSEQQHFAVGVPFAGQSSIAPKALMGNCVSILPVVVQLDDKANLAELAKHNMNVFKSFDAIGSIPLDAVDAEGNEAHPKMNVMFNMDRMPQSKAFAGTRLEMLPVEVESSMYDLFFNLMEFKGKVVFDIDFNSELFGRQTVSRWLNLYLSIMQQWCDNPERSLYELQTFTAEDERIAEQAMASTNLTQLEYQLGVKLSAFGIEDGKVYGLILNNQSRPVLTDQYGYLYIGKNRVELYHTGWAARMTSSSELVLLGPYDRCYYKDGQFYSLWLIENVLNQCPAIKAASLRYDEASGDIEAFVEPAAAVLFANQLVEWCLLRMPVHMLPKRFYLGGDQGQSEKVLLAYKVDAMTATEAAVFQSIGTLLGLEAFGKHENILSLGMNSLKLLKLLSEIQEQHDGIRIPISMLSDALTVSSIAAVIEELRHNEYLRATPITKAKAGQPYYETSSAQKRMYVLHQLLADTLNYNMPSVVRVEGEFDLDKFKSALNQCVARHENLRTRFLEADGEIVQAIADVEPIQTDVIELRDESNDEELMAMLKKEFVKPFDLSSAPLMRVNIIKHGIGKHIVFFDFHHIIFDGSSALVFAREIMTLYNEAEVMPLSCQYKDFVVWQSERLHSEQMLEQEGYWKELLSDASPASYIPLDYIRPDQRTYAGKLVKYEIKPDVKRRIAELCKEQGSTKYAFFLTALNVLLSLYTRQKDIVVGTLVEGRNHHELHDLIGMFVNTLPIRNTVNQEQSFLSFMQSVQQQAMKAFAHSDVPFERMVELSGVWTEKGRNPLFDMMFSYQDFDSLQLAAGGTTFQYEELWTDDCKFDIEFEVVDSGSDCHLIVQYAAELYEPHTIHRLINRFMALIDCILADAGKKLSELDMITAAEKHQILEEFNQPAAEFPEDRNLVSEFEDWAERTPDKTAVLFEEQKVTYAELNVKANQMARLLLSKGLCEEDTVGIMLHRSPDMVRSILGIWKAGGAYMPLDVEHPVQRRLDILHEAGVKFVLTQSGYVEKEFSERYAGVILHLDELEQQLDSWHAGNPGKPVRSPQLAYLLFTSGSTGKPKGVMIEHAGMLNHIWAERDLLGLNEHMIFAQNANHCFDISVWQLVGALALGGTTAIYSNELVLQPKSFIERVIKDGVTLLEVVPSYMSVMMDHAESSKADYKALEHLIITGEMVKPHLLTRWFALYPDIAVVNAYGPAEASDDISQYVLRGMPEELAHIPIGKPLTNVRIYIMDDEGRLCPEGIIGELCVAGISVGRGYVNNEEKTKLSFTQDPFAEAQACERQKRMYRTGDLARWLPDGNIEYLGRMDEQVKIRGYRIELGEIESALRKQPGIRDTAIIAKEDPSGDKYICAYVVLADGSEPFDAAQSREELRKELPSYMLPSYFVTLARMPVTSNGKLDRRALPEPDRSGGQGGTAPRNETEAKLAEVFQEVLGVASVGIDESFFELGGHSLRAMRVVNLIESQLGVRLPLRAVFEHPTVETLSKLLLNTGQEAAYEPIPPAEKKDSYPMSSAQKRLFVIHQMDHSSTVYNMPGMLEMLGELDLPRINRAFEQLVARHESLRTSFHLIEGEPVQRIHEQVSAAVEYGESEGQTEEELLGAFVRPFDVGDAPLIRLKVVKAGEGRSVLLFDMHHLISDGATITIITKEFSQLYNGEELEQPTVHYKDYSEWLRTIDLSKHKEYWLSQFSDDLPVLDLPLDYPRPNIQRYNGAALHQQLSAGTREQVQALGRKTGATEYMVLLSGLMVLLGKYSRQEDIIVGSPISGRTHHDTERMIGMFVGTLAMRGKPAGSKAYKDFLSEVKETSLRAYEHQAYPFEDMVEQVQVRRDLSRNPIFDVMFVLQNNEEEQLDAQGMAFGDLNTEARTAKFDLTVNVTADASGYLVSWEYSSDLFKQETIARMAAHFERLVQSLTEAPEKPLCELEMITEAEKQQLLVDFHAAPADYPMDRTIKDLFEEQVRRTPDRVAAVFENEQLTYAELNAKANGVAARLLQEKGTGETIVGLLLGRNLNLLVGILGAVKAGCTYLPIDPDAPEDRIRYTLEDSQAKLLLTSVDLPLPGFGVQTLFIEELPERAEEAGNPDLTIRPDDALYIIYTSGTTGNPKGTVIEHRNVVRLLVNDQMLFDFTEHDVWSLFHSYNFDFSVWEMYGALLYGGKVVVIPKAATKDSYAFLDILRKEQVTVVNQVPSAFYELMHAEMAEDGERLQARYLIFGGEALHVGKLKDWQAKYPEMKLINMYGITETTVHVTFKAIGAAEIAHGISNIGQAIPTLKLHILNGDELCGIGIPGELCISGAGVARGYLNRPELTKAKFVDHPHAPGERMYRSGDLARWLADGNIEYLGRIDDQVKIRGYRIELKEIENVLMKQAGVKDAAVIVRKDQAGDSYLSAYVVGDPQQEEVDISRIREGIRHDLPDYMVPVSIMALLKLPITGNGKLDRRQLPEPAFTERQAYAAPRDEREQTLARIFEEVLGMERIGIDDHFFELGGDSIKAIRVISKLREAGYDLSVKNLMLERTIRLIAWKTEQLAEGIQKYPQGELAGDVRLTPIQQQFYSWNLAKPHHYNQTMLLSTAAALNADSLRQALMAIVKHHDMLRAVYSGDGRQTILSVDESKGFDFAFFELESLQDSQVRQVIEEEGQKLQESISLADGPLMKVGLFRTGQGDYLLLCLHHLVVDGVSWRIIGEDLETLYQQLERGEEAVLPSKTASYQQWAEALEEYAGSEELERELHYWKELCRTEVTAPDEGQLLISETGGSFHTVTVELGADNTSKLLYESSRAYHTEINDLLLTAFARSVKETMNEEDIMVDLEGHGRESIHKPMDIDRTVGWFTTIFPVQLPYCEDMELHICSTKEMLRKVPNHGLGYGVVRFLREKEWPMQINRYCFNYLGELDNELAENRIFAIADMPTGDSVSKENRHANAFTLNASVMNAKLVLELTYDQNRFAAEQIIVFQERYNNAIKEIIAHCAAKETSHHTASDFGDLELEMDEFNEIMKNYS